MLPDSLSSVVKGLFEADSAKPSEEALKQLSGRLVVRFRREPKALKNVHCSQGC